MEVEATDESERQKILHSSDVFWPNTRRKGAHAKTPQDAMLVNTYGSCRPWYPIYGRAYQHSRRCGTPVCWRQERKPWPNRPCPRQRQRQQTTSSWLTIEIELPWCNPYSIFSFSACCRCSDRADRSRIELVSLRHRHLFRLRLSDEKT